MTLPKWQFGGASSHVYIDESLFTHVNGDQCWVLGLRQLEGDRARIYSVSQRNVETIIHIIQGIVMPGNVYLNDFKRNFGNLENPAIITTDGWGAYNALDSIPGYRHIVVNHSESWGYGIISTNPIEQLWAWIKDDEKSVYGFFPPQSLMEFVVESLWRRQYKVNRPESLTILLGDHFFNTDK